VFYLSVILIAQKGVLLHLVCSLGSYFSSSLLCYPIISSTFDAISVYASNFSSVTEHGKCVKGSGHSLTLSTTLRHEVGEKTH
jgi:hypothetical protein